MQSFEPSENWVPTLHLGEMHVQTPQIITCANRYFLGCYMFVHANNSLPKPMALSVHLCPHCKFLHFLSKTKVKTASCMCRAHTCLTGVMWQTQTPEPLACLEELLSLWREDSLLPVWRWRHCFSGRVVLQGTDFWRSSVHCTVSHPWSTCQADQQMLAGLHHGEAVSGPQWEPPWSQTRTPAPALSPCGMSCRMLPAVTFCRLTPMQSAGCWPPVQLRALFKDICYCCGLLDSLWLFS